LYAALVAFGFSALLAVFIRVLKPEQGVQLIFEFAKFLIQVIVVVVAGQQVLSRIQRRAEKKRNANEFRKSLLRSLVRSYIDAKKARRLLRASCVRNDDKYGIPFDSYEKHLQLLNQVQLELEVIAKEIDFFPKAFSDPVNAEYVFGMVTRMEEYLNEVITEFETALQTFQPHTDCLPLTGEPALEAARRFLLPRAEGTFHRHFAKPFQRALRVFVEEEDLKL
jgi:hypothetical protein